LSRADLLLRKGEIEALVASGCETVWIGAESGSQAVLDRMQKGTTISQILDASRSLREAGIRVGFFIQFGYPGEAWRDIAATFRLVRMAMPNELGISVAYPLPGTGFMEQVKTQLVANTPNWRDSDDLAMLYRGPFPTRFYRLLHRQLHDYLALLRTVQAPRTSTRMFIRSAIKAGYLAATLTLRSVALVAVQFAKHRQPVEIRPELHRAQASTPSVQET
ncbi:MAG TPA: radical SAM protein, partial [Pseudomonadales bacterium]|nr:radical SAM protein [Pseudomonadales bacterium]